MQVRRQATWIGRVAGCALGGIAVLCPAYAAERPELSDTATVVDATVVTPHRRAYPPRTSRPPVAQPSVVEVAFGDDRVLFVDVDGNGRFDDRNIDAWTLPGDAYRYAVPYERWIVVDKRQIWLEFADDNASVAYAAETFVPVERPGERLQKPRNIKRRKPSEILAALVAWNDLRLRNGLLPARLSNELSDGCHKHALYCARHGITHVEIPEKDLYTPEGDEAGRWSGIGSEKPPVEVDQSYQSLFHRIQLVHATTEEVGIGYAKGVTVLDGSRGRNRRKWQLPVCIPAADTVGHPRTCAPERPVPHPDVFGDYKSLRGAGCPITLTFVHDDIKDVTAELREGGPEGKPVKMLLSWPEQPASPEIPDNYKTIGILPRTALKSRKRYWVHVSYVYRGEAGERTWEFTTGK